MIRFIDLREQNIGAKFAFFDTITNRFITYDGNAAWDDWPDFNDDAFHHTITSRYKHLCPDWVEGL